MKSRELSSPVAREEHKQPPRPQSAVALRERDSAALEDVKERLAVVARQLAEGEREREELRALLREFSEAGQTCCDALPQSDPQQRQLFEGLKTLVQVIQNAL
jgi:putative heme degradation protein